MLSDDIVAEAEAVFEKLGIVSVECWVPSGRSVLVVATHLDRVRLPITNKEPGDITRDLLYWLYDEGQLAWKPATTLAYFDTDEDYREEADHA